MRDTVTTEKKMTTMTALSRFDAALDKMREARESGDADAIAAADEELTVAYELLIAFNKLFR